MKSKKLLLAFLTSTLAIILTGCGGVKINSKVFVKEQADYTFTTNSGTYTYRIVLEPRKGSISGTTLGTTTKDSKLVLYRDDLPRETPVTPGVPPKPIVHRLQSFEIKSGAKYVKEDSPDEGKAMPRLEEGTTPASAGGEMTSAVATATPEASLTTFEITIDITTDTEGAPENDEEEHSLFYLVDFKARKQT